MGDVAKALCRLVLAVAVVLLGLAGSIAGAIVGSTGAVWALISLAAVMFISAQVIIHRGRKS